MTSDGRLVEMRGVSIDTREVHTRAGMESGYRNALNDLRAEIESMPTTSMAFKGRVLDRIDARLRELAES